MAIEKQRMPVDSSKVCGTCRFLRHPIYHQSRLIEVCEKAVNSKICSETLAELTDEVLCIYRKSFWCSKDKCWTHLLDNCSLWQLKQDKNNRDHLELSDTF